MTKEKEKSSKNIFSRFKVQEIEQARRLAEQKAQEAAQKENEARELEEQLREARMRVSHVELVVFVCQ